MQHRGSAPGLHNGSSPRLYERKQKNQSQYYTFHPKSLYKDFPNNEEKPSVLELENNYLLKHHQQYNNRDTSGPRDQQQWIGSPLAEEFNMLGRTGPNRVDYYVQTNVLAGGRRPLPSANPAIPPRLARVRSDEYLLGTRSEPDLRPMAAIPPDEENSRWFVALYDYSYKMSPNPNAQQEELSFRKHQLIKVYGDADPTASTTPKSVVDLA
uniref:Uncharacterized protein n=1 Tax=Ditylenchus dipsaci TaxID=166011 RepID=A0A915EMX5_9BILA